MEESESECIRKALGHLVLGGSGATGNASDDDHDDDLIFVASESWLHSHEFNSNLRFTDPMLSISMHLSTCLRIHTLRCLLPLGYVRTIWFRSVIVCNVALTISVPTCPLCAAGCGR